MSYADPDRRFYSFPGVAFGTSTAQYINGPRGKKGTLKAIHVSATVLFTAVTTSGRVDVGNATTAAAYGSLTLGTLAAAAAMSSDDSGQTADPIVANHEIAANTVVKVSFVAPTGGSPAGTGTVSVMIDWER